MRNCSQRAISHFSTVFSTNFQNFLPFSSNLKLSSANSFRLEESKICRRGLKVCCIFQNNAHSVLIFCVSGDFTLTFQYTSENGTGTGEIDLDVDTVDGIPLGKMNNTFALSALFRFLNPFKNNIIFTLPESKSVQITICIWVKIRNE